MSVVEFLQSLRGHRRRTVSRVEGQLELQPVEVLPLEQDVHLQRAVREVADLLAATLADAHLTQERAAAGMFISGSLFGRQLSNTDNQHLSLQRLWLLPDAFWREFVAQVIERRQLARVTRFVEGL